MNLYDPYEYPACFAEADLTHPGINLGDPIPAGQPDDDDQEYPPDVWDWVYTLADRPAA